MSMILIVAATLSALLAIAAESRSVRHPAFYVLKPLTTLIILALALSRPAQDSAYLHWVAVGLVLSTLGDISLMFKGDRWFMGGLSSFLLAHIAFIVAFVHGVPTLHPPLWAYAVIPAALALLAVLLPRAGALKIPVVIYCSVIVAMLLTACARYTALGNESAWLAMLGAAVFLVSDSALAIRQFGGIYRGAQALILSTYWLAIGLIACSV